MQMPAGTLSYWKESPLCTLATDIQAVAADYFISLLYCCASAFTRFNRIAALSLAIFLPLSAASSLRNGS